MKNTILIIIVSLFCTLNGNACLNEYAIDSSGNRNDFDGGYLAHYLKHNKSNILKRLNVLSAQLAIEPTYELYNDYAVNLLKIGKTKEAVNIFKTLLNHNSNEYNILANIGTAYELNDEVDSAFKYINLAYAINSSSHNESEWVHINILKSKLSKLNRAIGAPILNFDIFKNKDSIAISNLMRCLFWHTDERINASKSKTYTLLVNKQVEEQLKERLPFTPHNDVFVAQLCKELGDLLFANISMSKAYFYYKLGIYYNDAYKTELTLKTNYIEKTIPAKRGIFKGNFGDLNTYKSIYKDFEKEFKKDVPLIVSDYEVKFQ